MTPFLTEVAAHLYSHYNKELHEMCLVFPNRRSITYFRKSLSEQLQQNKVIWAPEMMTINDLLGKLSTLKLADSMELVFDLYVIYKKHKGTEESFDNFYSWGEVLLNDFDEIDKNLVQAKNLFRNLSDIKSKDNDLEYLSNDQKEIISKFWASFKLKDTYAYEKEFIGIWSVLYAIYNDLRDVLAWSGKAYEGMIFRDIAERIESEGTIETGFKKIAFIGFNALNKCERKFMLYLKNSGKAIFYWDYDEYYWINKSQEAGFFIRDNLNDFPPEQTFIIPTDNFCKNKDIEVIHVPSFTGQAKLAGQVLAGEWKEKDMDNTVLVLADENMLQPILTSIPSTVSDVNITMGYPVRQTQAYSLIDALIGLQQNIRKNKSGDFLFYHAHVTRVLSHPLIKQSISDSNVIEKILQKILEQNKITIAASEINEKVLDGKVFKFITDTGAFQDYLLDILIAIGRKINVDNEQSKITYSIELENLFQVIILIQKLKNIITDKKIQLALPTYSRLLRRYLNTLRIPYSGEPLKGLQVMGILETRCLDFQNLCIVSMNEGVLPKRSAGISYIPFNLRKAFGLTTIEHQDAIYAYYFYRLLQRAQKVKLIYNSSQEGLNSGEESRYILQLKYESGIALKEKQVVYSIATGKAKKIEIPKSEQVMNSLKQYCQGTDGKYLSPSALNSYIECSLLFYLRHIAGLEEKSEVSEDIDHAVFGNLLHNTINYLYKGFIGTVVQKMQLETLLKDDSLFDAAIMQAFIHEKLMHQADDDISGNAFIIRNIIKKMTYQIIKTDLGYLPFKITGLEQKIVLQFPLQSAAKDYTVILGGRIDRIDEQEGIVRIIDYKTGIVENKIDTIQSLFTLNAKKRNKAAFQVMLYSLLYKESIIKNSKKIVPGIYSTKKIFDKDFDYKFAIGKEPVEDAGLYFEDFMIGLSDILRGLFNPDIPFTQTTETKTCEVCPYKSICHK